MLSQKVRTGEKINTDGLSAGNYIARIEGKNTLKQIKKYGQTPNS